MPFLSQTFPPPTCSLRHPFHLCLDSSLPLTHCQLPFPCSNYGDCTHLWPLIPSQFRPSSLCGLSTLDPIHLLRDSPKLLIVFQLWRPIHPWIWLILSYPQPMQKYSAEKHSGSIVVLNRLKNLYLFFFSRYEYRVRYLSTKWRFKGCRSRLGNWRAIDSFM